MDATPETAERGADDVVEMSGSRSCRSGQSWSATGRRLGPRTFARRDTPRHVHVHKHDRGLMLRIFYDHMLAMQAMIYILPRVYNVIASTM